MTVLLAKAVGILTSGMGYEGQSPPPKRDGGHELTCSPLLQRGEHVKPERLALELQADDISGVQSWELVEELHHANGRVEENQRIYMAPEVFYSLYRHLKQFYDPIEKEMEL